MSSWKECKLVEIIEIIGGGWNVKTITNAWSKIDVLLWTYSERMITDGLLNEFIIKMIVFIILNLKYIYCWIFSLWINVIILIIHKQRKFFNFFRQIIVSDTSELRYKKCWHDLWNIINSVYERCIPIKSHNHSLLQMIILIGKMKW